MLMGSLSSCGGSVDRQRSPSVRVCVRGADRHAEIVRYAGGAGERSLFLFVSRNRKRAKVLYFDGTGLCLFAKRLEKGSFAAVCDRERSRTVKLTLSELVQFIEGSAVIGRSPALLTWADLTPRWPEPKK
jgi:transposase